MSFFEDIALALDAEGVESRVNDEVLFVPITSDLEIQFVEIDPLLPAANVYIAAADVDEDDEEFEAVLVSVAFSVDDAVEAVARHIATDQVVTVLRDLLEGTDERIAELEFTQDEFNPNLVVAEVANDSELRVLVETVDGIPQAVVRFLAFDVDEDQYDAAFAEDSDFSGDSAESADSDDSTADLDYNAAEEDAAIARAWADDELQGLGEEERLALFEAGELSNPLPVIEIPAETLELGTYTDFDRLFDVLSLVAEQALDWEAQLVNFDGEEFDEPDVYDIFGEDDGDDDYDDDDDLDDDLDADDLDDTDAN